MTTHNFIKLQVFALLFSAIISPLSALAGPSRKPIVINISGPTNIPSQPVVTPIQENLKTKEIKFSLGTQEQVGYTPSCPSQFGGITSGSGKGTHLGVISLAAKDCIIPMQNYFISNNGNLTITAANGDNITGTYSGSFIPTDNPSIYMYDDFTIQITGGTGRFKGATGSGALEGTSNTITGQGVIEGTISITY
ncbi:MAG: hypothetical protein Q8K74_06210 [Candidatus Nitrotoga sp.]|nr:hypothetical protein [Candidatus Nitrotoga sp.]MDP1855630.1 hypothetical protein [Candidatus Nitrotoga sp.]RFC41320.1 MAG: hypothetical protein DID89_2727545997 [Candidatus Nitrotoga sp. CP45]